MEEEDRDKDRDRDGTQYREEERSIDMTIVIILCDRHRIYGTMVYTSKYEGDSYMSLLLI